MIRQKVPTGTDETEADRYRSPTHLAILGPLALALAVQGCTGGDSDDYLKPDLRQRVEALKLEAPESTEDCLHPGGRSRHPLAVGERLLAHRRADPRRVPAASRQREPLTPGPGRRFRDTPGRSRVPNQKAPLLDEMYAGLRDQNSTDDVLVIPHAHQPGDWTNSDPDMERLVEIQSGHGTFDWFDNKYLQNGFEVGFIGASDNHNGHPGYSGMGNRQLGGLAAVFAPENNADAITQPATYHLARNAEDRNRIDFDFPTRGRPKSLVLELRGASPATVVTVEMETTTESRGSGGYVRVPQELPANTVRFRLGDLKGQVDRREYRVLEHTDALSAQIVTEGRALDQEFSFTDQGEARPGDYYYLRVRQIDGSMAWSSPFWVGASSE